MLQQNFSRPHITNAVMENVADFFLQFRLAASAIGNKYLCRKQDFLSHPDKSSLPAVKVSIDWEIGGI